MEKYTLSSNMHSACRAGQFQYSTLKITASGAEQVKVPAVQTTAFV